MKRPHLELLTTLLAIPTAPFREQHVIAAVTEILQRAGVPYFTDPIGNIAIGCASQADYFKLLSNKTAEPVRLFVAHLDHPGFLGQRWLAPDRIKVKWHGGSPIRHLRGSRVWLAAPSGYIGEGRLATVRLAKSGLAIDTAEVRTASFSVEERPAAKHLFGGFRFRAPCWRAGKRLYAQAMDDLVGVYAVVITAISLFPTGQRRKHPPFLGLLTRAEEVGFVGALAHLELGWLNKARRPVVTVSLETSRTLPGAVIGRGPVVRLGDRRTVFHPDALEVLTGLARQALPKKHQRRIMDGGTCEATAMTVYGLPAIGLSVPLGNYHNQGFEGGPDCRGREGPAPEFVHLDDIDGLFKLCRGLMQPGLPWRRPWAATHQRLKQRLKAYRKLL